MSFQVGDRVEVYYPTNCCNSNEGFGRRGIVEIITEEEASWCRYCGRWETAERVRLFGDLSFGRAYRLRKLPPLVDEEAELLEEIAEDLNETLRVLEHEAERE